ncbi:MAG: glyoxalase [Alphaproteobacteria bacterium HGW-Alphaproteobacteria-11]|nr:MAG: glyoxalase [Alphaproteobacteria bacterium HGW-Alphaproteobacteria-11]
MSNGPVVPPLPPAPSLAPHLVIDGAAAALDFYKKALGATELVRVPSEDGKRLLHAHMEVNGAAVFLCDDFPEHPGEGAIAPKRLGGTSAMIHLQVKNCDAAVKRAADAGAKVIAEPWDAFWGDRYAQIMDPFGHVWSFAHPLPGNPA